MDFDILAGGHVIGRASIDRFERASGTAIGQFTPTASYDPDRHAANVAGEPRPLTSRLSLEVRAVIGESLTALDICIFDYRSTLGRDTIEIYIIGIPAVMFDEYFGSFH